MSDEVEKYHPIMLEDISNKIKFGRYTVKKKEGKNAGQYYHLLRDIYDENGVRLLNLFFCSKCENLIKHIPARGTTPLNRHANDCNTKKKENEAPLSPAVSLSPAEANTESVVPVATLNQCAQVMNQSFFFSSECM